MYVLGDTCTTCTVSVRVVVPVCTQYDWHSMYKYCTSMYHLTALRYSYYSGTSVVCKSAIPSLLLLPIPIVVYLYRYGAEERKRINLFIMAEGKPLEEDQVRAGMSNMGTDINHQTCFLDVALTVSLLRIILFLARACTCQLLHHVLACGLLYLVKSIQCLTCVGLSQHDICTFQQYALAIGILSLSFFAFLSLSHKIFLLWHAVLISLCRT